MLPKMINDLKQSAGMTLRLGSLAIAVATSLFITTAFLCAALFVFVLDRYGLVDACLAGAAAFLVVTLIATASYITMKRNAEKRAAAAKAASASLLTDPAMLAIGLQLARMIGIKKLVPILALGGLVLGLMSHRDTPPKDDNDDDANS